MVNALATVIPVTVVDIDTLPAHERPATIPQYDVYEGQTLVMRSTRITDVGAYLQARGAL